MHDVVIIGCGQIAGGYDADRADGELPLTHAAAFQRAGGFRLIACVEPDEERRSAFARRWQVEHAVPNMAMLPDLVERPAVVSICSPTAFHAEHIEAAVRIQPRLIFCEKPLTSSVLLAAQLVGGCAKAGILLAVNYVRRWAPDMVALAASIAAGKFGAVRSIVAVYNKGVLNNGSHMVDLLHMLVGPMELIAAGEPVADFWENDPTVPALLRTGTGTIIHLVAAHAGDYALFEVTLITERGAFTIEDSGRIWRDRPIEPSPHHPGYRILGTGDFREGGYAVAMLAAVENIRAALERGEPLASDGANALAAQRFCATILANASGPRTITGEPSYDVA